MKTDRTSPDYITSLQPNEIFVFGSNEGGQHLGGAARLAHNQFGAEWGRAVGHSGNTYAIPTVNESVSGKLPLSTIAAYVKDFIVYAENHPDQTFLVTEIGCGIAGFKPEEIAPLFRNSIDIPNIHLPKRFWEVIQ